MITSKDCSTSYSDVKAALESQNLNHVERRKHRHNKRTALVLGFKSSVKNKPSPLEYITCV